MKLAFWLRNPEDSHFVRRRLADCCESRICPSEPREQPEEQLRNRDRLSVLVLHRPLLRCPVLAGLPRQSSDAIGGCPACCSPSGFCSASRCQILWLAEHPDVPGTYAGDRECARERGRPLRLPLRALLLYRFDGTQVVVRSDHARTRLRRHGLSFMVAGLVDSGRCPEAMG